MYLVILMNSLLQLAFSGEIHATVITAPYKFRSIQDAIIRRTQSETRRSGYTSRGVVVGSRALLRRRVSAYQIMTMLHKYKHDEDTIYIGKRRARILAFDNQTRIALLEVALPRPRYVMKGADIDTSREAVFWSDDKWRKAPFVEDGRVLKVKNLYGATNESLLPGTPVYQSQRVVGFIWQVDDLYIRMVPAK